MCGISGFNWQDEKKLGEMMDLLSHRGPDARGTFLAPGISLGHNRLSIIDTSVGANQPMSDNVGDLEIVFNGEIYNFLELKKDLAGEYDFKTKGDTEVILAVYKKWGKEAVKKLNGMFSFAIWDKRNQSLFCARDHAGMKPFYYFWDGKKFVFASEIKGILAHDIPRQLNFEAFNQYLRVSNSAEPLTLIEKINKLPPFHFLYLKGDCLMIESYDQDETIQTRQSSVEATQTLRKKVQEAVRRHLIADVPVGVYLSGGIDSSLVLASAVAERGKLETFSVGFELADQSEQNKFNQDLILAQKTADFFGVNHNRIMVSAQDMADNFEQMVCHNSDPVSNPTAMAMMLLSRLAKEKVTVALTGNGGDEYFGGYERYRKGLMAQYYQRLPHFVKYWGNKNSKIAKLDQGRPVDIFSQLMFEKDFKLSRVISPSFLIKGENVKSYFAQRYFEDCASDLADCLMKADQRSWLPDHFFMLSDKMSMANAVEERMPLADKELILFSRSIPRKFKIDLFGTKKILKDAFREDLPEYLFHQPKRGWFSPTAKWLREPILTNLAREILSPDYYQPTAKLFEWKAVGEMFDNHVSKKEYNLTLLWVMITFQAWARHNKIEV